MNNECAGNNLVTTVTRSGIGRLIIPKNYVWPYLFFDPNRMSFFQYLRHFKVRNGNADDLTNEKNPILTRDVYFDDVMFLLGLNKASDRFMVPIQSEMDLLRYLYVIPSFHSLDEDEAVYEYNDGTKATLNVTQWLEYGREALSKILMETVKSASAGTRIRTIPVIADEQGIKLWQALKIVNEWHEWEDNQCVYDDDIFHLFMHEIINSLNDRTQNLF